MNLSDPLPCPFPGWRLGVRLGFMTSQRRPHLANHHPAVVEDLTKHAEQTQLRIADAITKYAGSMLFVYVHIAVFAFWMLVLERSPWPTLTLVVSLEAIFLSTFVMTGQNRPATFQQQKADHDFLVEEHELDTNTARNLRHSLRNAATGARLRAMLHVRNHDANDGFGLARIPLGHDWLSTTPY
jgi:uncharacterized membrane protein